MGHKLPIRLQHLKTELQHLVDKGPQFQRLVNRNGHVSKVAENIIETPALADVLFEDRQAIANYYLKVQIVLSGG